MKRPNMGDQEHEASAGRQPGREPGDQSWPPQHWKGRGWTEHSPLPGGGRLLTSDAAAAALGRFTPCSGGPGLSEIVALGFNGCSRNSGR